MLNLSFQVFLKKRKRVLVGTRTRKTNKTESSREAPDGLQNVVIHPGVTAGSAGGLGATVDADGAPSAVLPNEERSATHTAPLPSDEARHADLAVCQISNSTGVGLLVVIGRHTVGISSDVDAVANFNIRTQAKVSDSRRPGDLHERPVILRVAALRHTAVITAPHIAPLGTQKSVRDTITSVRLFRPGKRQPGGRRIESDGFLRQISSPQRREKQAMPSCEHELVLNQETASDLVGDRVHTHPVIRITCSTRVRNVLGLGL